MGVPKPTSEAMHSTGSSVISSSCCARATRSAFSHFVTVVPVVTRKRRVNVRRLIFATLASISRVIGSDKCSLAHSSTSTKRPTQDSCRTGCSIYCACPPCRCGGVTSCLAIRLAISEPCCCRIISRQQSNAATVPAEVTIVTRTYCASILCLY